MLSSPARSPPLTGLLPWIIVNSVGMGLAFVALTLSP